MGSRVTIPERRSGALRRLATVLPSFLFVAIAGAGCPPHQATLSITTTGALVLRAACQLSCDRSADGGIESSCACALSNRSPPDLENRAIQAKLFLVTPADDSIRDTSKCMTLLPCADGGRLVNCLAENLNQQLDGALPQGLGFDGLSNPDDVQLILAFYQPTDAATVSSCNRADLVACAGLAPPLGGGNYDISCASCQGGPKNAPGPDNGPCPKPKPTSGKSYCFLEACNDILAKNNY